MNPRIVKFINLEFDGSGYAINPFTGTNAFTAADFIDAVLTVVGTGTVIVSGSAQELPPDFSAVPTITNSHTPIALADYSLATSQILAGSAGVTVAGVTKLVELNTNLLTWIGINRSINTVDVLLTETNNQ